MVRDFAEHEFVEYAELNYQVRVFSPRRPLFPISMGPLHQAAGGIAMEKAWAVRRVIRT